MRKIWMGLVVVLVLTVLAWTLGIFAEDVQVSGGPNEDPMVSGPSAPVVNPGNNNAVNNPLNVVTSGPIEDPMENSGPIEDPMTHNAGHSGVVNPGNNNGAGNPLNTTPTFRGPIEDPMESSVGPIEDPIE